MSVELFELEILGGGIEKRYRKMRPEVEAMPWGTLSPSDYPESLLIAARRSWTSAAFQEHRTGVACCATLRALIEARAPIDLIAMASRFPLDEMVHVELCARMAMELGGGTEILHEPDQLTKDPDPSFRVLVRAAELVTRFFCVGEALSIPLLRGTWRAARHPLARAVLGRIVKDEAAHGAFGWTFLDWAIPELKADEIEHLRVTADHAISLIYDLWADIRLRPRAATGDHHPLGWLETEAYLALAQRSLAQKVIAPLRERGIAVQPLRPPV
jgi:hypothetical protein